MTTVLPEVNFLTTDSNELLNDIISNYEAASERKLARADPLRLIFLALTSVITKQNVKINDAARQNLLYYARGNVLDHKGSEWTTKRLEATAAKVTIRLHMTTQLENSRIVKKGALVTSNETTVFFETLEETVIPAGTTQIDIECKCTEKGIAGNDFYIGQLTTLVEPLPYVSHVENITISAGGAEREEDEPYRQRIYLAPESLSTAGSKGAYEYFAKKASALIGDVYVYTNTPGHVNISVLLQNGDLPTEEIINAVYESCSDKTVRPLTDFLNVSAPDVVEFDVDVTYFIDSNVLNVQQTQEKVLAAIDEYVIWQSSKIGRSVNDTKLINGMYNAGAKRIEVSAPLHVQLFENQVAKLRNKNVIFGGVEDD